MSNNTLKTNFISSAAAAIVGFGAIASGAQAAALPGIAQTDAAPLIILAETAGMERREERRDDRQDRREDRRDCRDEEGIVGKDKRDCKQDDRQERRDGGEGEG